MEKNQLISIVIPIYNVEEYLDRCLGSVIKQRYRNFECILVDDGSTDSSAVRADEWAKRDDRFIVFHKANGGLSSARNYGIARCRGRYITFIDSDDWVYPDYLDVLLNEAVTFDADIAVSPAFRVSDEQSAAKITRAEDEVSVYSQKEYLNIFFRVRGNRTVHYAWGKLYKCEVLDCEQYPVGMLNEDVEGFYKALLKAKIIVETKRQLYCYYFNQHGITGRAFGDNYLNLLNVWERIVSISRKERPDLVNVAEYNLKRTDFTILCDMILRGDSKSDEAYGNIEKEILGRLRRNLPTLMRGRMSIERKAAVVIVALSYRPLKQIVRAINHRLRG